MDGPTLTVTIDGVQHQVPADGYKLPEGVALYGGDYGDPTGYTKSDRFNSEVDRRVQGLLRNEGYMRPEDAQTDDWFKNLAQKRGIELGDDLKPVGKITSDQRDAIARAVRADEVEPLKGQLADATGQLAALQAQQLRYDLQQKLSDDLKPDAFRPVVDGQPDTSPFGALVAALVKRDDDGRPYYEGEGGVPNYDVSAALLKYVAKNRKDFLADVRQRTAGPGGRPGAGQGTVMRRADFDALPAQSQVAFIAKGGSVTD